MTLREIEEKLSAAGIAEARTETKILAEHFCNIAPYNFYYHRDDELGSESLDEAVKRRLSGEPLQYILGRWDFMNETYEVTPDVLIPRQETEILAEWAIKNIPQGGRFADICTGSGCIAVSVVAARDDLTCVALDNIPPVISIAKRNAVLNGVAGKISFILSDVLKDDACEGEFDAVLSNPPYVMVDDYYHLQKEIYYEPRHALTDEADGLTFYRRILDVYPKRLKPGGAIVFEIGASQAEDISEIAASCGMKTEIIKDYSGCDRVAVCTPEDNA